MLLLLLYLKFRTVISDLFVGGTERPLLHYITSLCYFWVVTPLCPVWKRNSIIISLGHVALKVFQLLISLEDALLSTSQSTYPGQAGIVHTRVP